MMKNMDLSASFTVSKQFSTLAGNKYKLFRNNPGDQFDFKSIARSLEIQVFARCKTMGVNPGCWVASPQNFGWEVVGSP